MPQKQSPSTSFTETPQLPEGYDCVAYLAPQCEISFSQAHFYFQYGG